MRTSNPIVFLALVFLSSFSTFTVALPHQVQDGDCELQLVSKADYEGRESSRPWLTDDSLTSADAVYREFLYEAFDYLVDHYRWPNEEVAEVIFENAQSNYLKANPEAKLPKLDLEKTLRKNRDSMLADMRRWFPNRYLYLRRKIASSYIRAVRQSDLPPVYRTVATTPSAELLFYAAIKTKTNGGPKLLLDVTTNQLDLENFKDLFVPDRPSKTRTGNFPQPLIFTGGWEDLEKAARFDAPFAFRSFHDTRNLVTEERAQKTLAAISQAKGFIVVAWTSAKQTPEDYLESMLALALKKGWPLIIGATQQNYETLPEEILNHPNVHILTHTIENRFLKLSVEPINPDIENPLVGVKKAGRYKPGQTVVVFHPHQMLETISTDTNESLPVTIISTGGLNEPFAPFASVSQGRTKTANKEFQKTKAFIFEKGDTLSPFDPDGVRNQWHWRPLTYANDKESTGRSGIIDVGHGFHFRYHPTSGERNFEVSRIAPSEIYLGDPHDPVTDPRFMQALLNLDIPTDAEITFLAGDWIDFQEISHWMDGRAIDQHGQFRKGGFSALKAINGVIQLMNAIQQRFPNARIGIDVGNHEEWLTRRMQKNTEIQDVINGDFYDELMFAVRGLKINVWDYLFNRRQKLLDAVLDSFPDKKSHVLDRIMPIFDPRRVVIMDRGQSYYSGPDWRRNLLGKHGDQASFGKKSPGAKDHARSMPEGGGVIGHTHTMSIYGEVMNPGTAGTVKADYGKGFYSGVGQGIVFVYPDGTKQLIPYNRMTGSFVQRDSKKVLSPERFFGDEPLRVIPNDNQLVDKNHALQFIRTELENLKKLTGN
jgi:hypothetical protein